MAYILFVLKGEIMISFTFPSCLHILCFKRNDTDLLYLSRWPPYSGLIASMSSLISVTIGFPPSGSTWVDICIKRIELIRIWYLYMQEVASKNSRYQTSEYLNKSFNRLSSSQRYAPHWWRLSDLDQTWSGWTVHHPKIPGNEKYPLGHEGGPFGGPEISIKGKMNSWFEPWLSMNKKFAWVASRGD